MGPAQTRAARAQVVAAVSLLMAGSLLLRTGRLDIGYWIDEAIPTEIPSSIQ